VLTVVYSPLLLLDWLGRLSVLTPYWYNLLFLAGRVVSLIAGVGTIIAAYVAGATAFSKRAGLFAAASLALVVTFVGYSKSTNVDVPCLFWFAVSLVFYLRLIDAPTVRDAALFATSAALAICTKDQAYALYLTVPLVLLYAVWRDRRLAGARARAAVLGTLIDRRLWSAAFVTVAVFALGNNLFFNFDGFARHVHWLTGDGSSPYKVFQPTLAGRLGLLSLTTRLDQQAWGWPFFVIGLGGVAIALLPAATRRSAIALLAIVVSFYLGFINIISYNYDRFILPIFLVQALFVGVAFDWLLSLKTPRVFWRQAAVGAVFAYSLLYAATVDVLMLRDSRYAVREWLLSHVAPGTRVGTIFPLRNRPSLDGYVPVEISEAEGLQREAPEYYVIDADYAHAVPPDSSNWGLVTGLQHGTLGYTLVLRYRSPSPWPWLPGADPDLVGPRLDSQVYSALRDINPTFEVYKRSF
jgi:4-amino-4-deoxy-L-arabinose transferase-like glycosyltransferase